MTFIRALLPGRKFMAEVKSIELSKKENLYQLKIRSSSDIDLIAVFSSEAEAE